MKKFFKKTSRMKIALAALLLTASALFSSYNIIIPNTLSCYAGDALPQYFGAGADLPASVETFSSGEDSVSTYTAQYKLFNMIPIKSVNVSVYKKTELYPGGMPFGVKFFTDGVIVTGYSDGTQNPAKAAGIRVHDVIISVNGKKITSAAQLTDIANKSGGSELEIKYTHDGIERSAKLKPYYCEAESRYKTGLTVRDSGAGIGTVTYIVPETGEFAGLGHGICDSETGKLIPIERGAVSGVSISGIVKGAVGAPGELKGYFKSGKTGSMIKNTDCGVYGVFTPCPSGIKPMQIGLKNELREGEAYILCTLDNESGIGKYSINISNINLNASAGKCFTVKVTDKALLAKTGGIVQGMSGSPIIQDGKIVGAVTHVMINDPTTGYGIFIENMLNAAQMPMAKAS